MIIETQQQVIINNDMLGKENDYKLYGEKLSDEDFRAILNDMVSNKQFLFFMDKTQINNLPEHIRVLVSKI